MMPADWLRACLNTGPDLDLQRDALLAAGCERIFETNSGKAGTQRPEFQAALHFLRPENVLVVRKLDRLGRSLVEMMRTIDCLRQKDVRFRNLAEHFDSETAHGRFTLQMHGAMAEYFLDLNWERTIEGLRAALARGRKGGRPRKFAVRLNHPLLLQIWPRSDQDDPSTQLRLLAHGYVLKNGRRLR
jgi:DNA invertase Pin-like site-specific DNA recombinase